MWQIILAGIIILGCVYLYNKMVQHKNYVMEAWSGIDVQLKLRSDLVPQIVTCVQAYKDFEQSTLEEVITLRSQAQKEQSLEQKQNIENQMSQKLGSLFALSERYPELKAAENFQQLQSELIQIEDRLQYARRYYNGTVRDHNIFLTQFPNVLILPLLGFRKKAFFEIVSSMERKNVEVSL